MLVSRYYPKKISEIDFKVNKKISILGKVAEIRENSFVLKDETGEIEIFSEEKPEGKIIRVFCSVEENKLKADIVQPLNGLDLNLYKEVEELYSKAGV